MSLWPGAIIPHMVAGAAGPVPATSVSRIATATAVGGSALTAPPNIDAGDLLVVINAGNSSPSGGGWTNPSTNVFYKIADGTEDGTNLGTIDHKILWQLRADAPIVSLSTRSGGGIFINDDGDPPQQTLNASAGVAPVVGITGFSNIGGEPTIDPRTTSITPTEEATPNSTNFWGHLYIQNSSPADYTWDMDDEGSDNELFGNYFHNIMVQA